MASGDRAGTVTRATSGSLPYIARSASGVNLGSYKNVGAAKDAVRQLGPSGGERLRWVRSDIGNQVEAYTAYLL